MNPFIKTKKQLSIFITAGYPTIESTIDQILNLQEIGVDFIELGIPFSDPMADGPVIQETSNIAIENGMNLWVLFQILKENKDKIKIPLVMMGYLNPILNFGIDSFLENCAQLNIRHAIIPDVSLEIYEKLYKQKFEVSGISLCFLVTPLSQNERIQKMANLSRNGFIYLVSQNAITGENKESSSLLESRYKEIKLLCGKTPMMIGFGIKNKEDISNAHQFADGAIIGSAYLKALKLKEEQGFLKNLIP